MTESLFDRFTSPATMMDAELELLAMGEAAVPLLETLLSGEAKNQWDVPYRELGLPLRCAIEVVRRLGSAAKPLEPHLISELEAGDPVAAMALGSLGSLEEPSVEELARKLSDGNSDLAFESAAALLKSGYSQHPAVLKAVAESERAERVLARVEASLSGRAPQ